MYQGHRIAVVIPVYNEEAFIGDVIDDQPSFVDTVYVVDDCSTDGTWQAVQHRAESNRATAGPPTTDGGERSVGARPSLEGESDDSERSGAPRGSSDRRRDTTAETPASPGHRAGGETAGPTVVPIRHEANRGRGGAVKTGYRAALDDDTDVIAVMDGDGQMDPDMLDALVGPIVVGEADYAKGNRLESSATRAEMSRWRFFGNVLLTALTRVSSGYWGITDSQNGYTAISRAALEDVAVDDLYDGYGFLNDVLVRLNAQNARLADVPMPAVYGDEESGIAYSSFVPMLSLLLGHRFVWRVATEYDVFEFPPIAVMYGLATVSAFGGLGYGLGALLVGVPGHGLRVTVVALSVCIALVGVAFLVERRHNSDLELELGSDSPLGNR